MVCEVCGREIEAGLATICSSCNHLAGVDSREDAAPTVPPDVPVEQQ